MCCDGLREIIDKSIFTPIDRKTVSRHPMDTGYPIKLA
jgi:hypothetical protein